MNKKYVFIVFGIVTLVLGGMFFKGLGPEETEEGKENIVAEKGGWIEVFSTSVFLVENKNGLETKKILSTGDAISEGNMIETDGKGKATIHHL